MTQPCGLRDYWRLGCQGAGRKGLQTLVLEAGRPIDPDQDYVEHVPEWEVRYRGMSDRKRVQQDQPVQETCGGMDEWNSKFFVSDKQNPYTTEPGKPFLWIRGRPIGWPFDNLGTAILSLERS